MLRNISFRGGQWRRVVGIGTVITTVGHHSVVERQNSTPNIAWEVRTYGPRVG